MSTSTYQRQIRSCPAIAAPIPVTAADHANADRLAAWLAAAAKTHRLRWLLAHLDDGVVWGRWEADQGLLTSRQAAAGDLQAAPWCPELRPATLQQARLFAAHAELMLWRDDSGGWCARLIRDLAPGEAVAAGTPAWDHAFDEQQLLWGTGARPLADGFSFLTHGQQGLRHALPYPLKLGKLKTQTLTIRHYLTRDGLAQVDASRLVSLPAAEAQI
jgi:CRISPR-associated protein (TIGR03984 family)